jgi:uncharacterized membrane protein YfcA
MKTFLNDWIFFSFSNKLKFSIKLSISMVLAFMIPMALAWDQPSTAAITVMLIASAGGVSESLSKGVTRIIGTVIGAVIGLTLIAVFPQDRLLYLLSLSLILMIIIYLYYTYRGDSSVFILSAMVIMMIFLQGPENAFLYGIDRTYMTIFGIVVYSVVGIFIWPFKAEIIDKETDFPEVESSLKKKSFVFLDPDNFKATLQLLCVFWASTFFWIVFNPPGGFLLVILATLLGLLTTFSPLKPTILMILLSIGFVFATAMYIFVLPNLVYAWQLGIFIFIYTFIGFYFIPPKITIFFLLGMFLLGIDNTMNYDFGIFLNILLVFYLFLIILMLFNNFPFSTKPEHLFLKNKERYFKHIEAFLSTGNKNKQKFHLFHLQLIIKKIELWSSKIDTGYFSKVSKEELALFVKRCEELIKQIEKPLGDKEKDSIIINLYKLKKTQEIDWDSLKENRF